LFAVVVKLLLSCSICGLVCRQRKENSNVGVPTHLRNSSHISAKDLVRIWLKAVIFQPE